MKPLDSLSKRDLLAAESYDPAVVREYAEAFLSQEYYSDALEFFQKLNDREAITKIKQVAVETASPDILWRIEHDNPEAVTQADWTDCGESAMRLGKFRAAAYVFERIGNSERLAAAEREFKPSCEDPEPPAAP